MDTEVKCGMVVALVLSILAPGFCSSVVTVICFLLTLCVSCCYAVFVPNDATSLLCPILVYYTFVTRSGILKSLSRDASGAMPPC